MRAFLSNLGESIENVSTDKETGDEDGQATLQNPKAFFRIWSALQFAFCVPPASMVSKEELMVPEKSNLDVECIAASGNQSKFPLKSDVVQYLDSAQFIQRLNEEIFDYLKLETK
ncbi:hypothetical protein HK101_008379 [Irineochytrium annulatum]|nr:hypothetical protein HK101_008379 [Irineochytrium annulatum]